MVPIGIITRERLGCLAATLYSLAATDLPGPPVIYLYDDGSEDPAMRAFLYEGRSVEVPRLVPPKMARAHFGLNILREVPPTICLGVPAGFQLVPGNARLGVFAQSCRALRCMYEGHPDAAGYILLQDDIVFKKDWYSHLCGAAAAYAGKRPLGLLGGIRLNRKIPRRGLNKRVRLTVTSYVTGQCLYFPRESVQAMLPWLISEEAGNRRHKWDDTVCKYLDKTLHRDVALLHPFCCQHIGLTSLVRPSRTWRQFGEAGRIGYYAYPPFVMGTDLQFGPHA